jgi:prepilin-type N-terminal cleavage/methylation domain-containing protein
MRFRRAHSRGFTLVELMVVVFLMALIMSVAMPSLLPMIVFSELQGAARHMANYGRSVVAEATLRREPLTVRFDLTEQAYYTIRLVYPEPELEEGADEITDQFALYSSMSSSGGSFEEMSEMLAASREGGGFDGFPEGFDDVEANQQLGAKFDGFAQRIMEERAKNVVPGESFLDEIGPLFEEEFTLDVGEPEEVELNDMVLERVYLPGNVLIESITVDGERQTGGLVEVTISPLGLDSEVLLHIVNEDAEYYTVHWDPVTGYSRFLPGKEELLNEFVE